MAKPHDLDSTLQALASTIAARLSEALIAGMNAAVGAVAVKPTPQPTKRGAGRPPKAGSTNASAALSAPPAKKGPGRPPSSTGKGCLVLGCGKKTVARGLCQGHYRKAVRLGVAKKLDKGNLVKLTKDGRATRWAKKR